MWQRQAAPSSFTNEIMPQMSALDLIVVDFGGGPADAKGQ